MTSEQAKAAAELMTTVWEGEFPATCQVPATCDVPASCQVARTCTIERNCDPATEICDPARCEVRLCRP